MAFAIIMHMHKQCVPDALSPPPLHLGMKLSMYHTIPVHTCEDEEFCKTSQCRVDVAKVQIFWQLHIVVSVWYLGLNKPM